MQSHRQDWCYLVIFCDMFKSIKSLRFWSLLLCATSVLPIAYFVYQNWIFSRWAKERVSTGGFVCGTGMFALLALCAVVTCVTACAASGLGFVGYLRSEKPRSKIRLLEITTVATYAAAAFVLTGGLLLG
jgi:hypothetical protein